MAKKRKGAFVKKQRCFKCKKPGHLAKDCPVAQIEMAALAFEKVSESEDRPSSFRMRSKTDLKPLRSQFWSMQVRTTPEVKTLWVLEASRYTRLCIRYILSLRAMFAAQY